jgi:hypothetical protein
LPIQARGILTRCELAVYFHAGLIVGLKTRARSLSARLGASFARPLFLLLTLT